MRGRGAAARAGAAILSGYPPAGGRATVARSTMSCGKSPGGDGYPVRSAGGFDRPFWLANTISLKRPETPSLS